MNKDRILNFALGGALLIAVLFIAYQSGRQSVAAPVAPTPASATGQTAVEPAAGSNADAVLAVIHSRKSVRNFVTPRKMVGDAELETLLRAGMAAPSAMNRQPWAFVALNDAKSVDKLAAVLPRIKFMKNAGAVIVACADMDKVGANNLFWQQDLSAVTENILLAAEATGLGATWCGGYPLTDRVNATREALKIPSSIIPISIIVIGYPNGTDKPKLKWVPEKVHFQQW